MANDGYQGTYRVEGGNEHVTTRHWEDERGPRCSQKGKNVSTDGRVAAVYLLMPRDPA